MSSEAGIQPSPGTRILATLGPASWDPETIEKLAGAGASGFRLNFSHRDHGIFASVIASIREVSRKLDRPLAILGDLAGPKLRTGALKGGKPVFLEDGSEVVITASIDESEPYRIAVDYPYLAEDLVPESRVLMDDGQIVLEVRRIEGDDVVARVVHGGRLGSHKGFNLPGVAVRVPSMDEADEADVAFCLEHEVDVIALSFVQRAADVINLKRLIAQASKDTPVIAKIEKPIAVENLSSILDVCDGIMVARGDLGVEMGVEMLPVVQKRIIQAARRASKMVITATQMLDSMTTSPSPTRAEASDVANAIFDGTDVTMLSQETAVGNYPVLAVATMRKIASHAEASELYREIVTHLQQPEGGGVAHAANRAACVAADELDARAIVAFTDSGWTAQGVAARRPETKVLALTHRETAWRRMALAWGIDAILMPMASDIGDLYVSGIERLLERGDLEHGDLVVVLSGSVLRGAGANTIKIYRVGHSDITDDAIAQNRLDAVIRDHRRRITGA